MATAANREKSVLEMEPQRGGGVVIVNDEATRASDIPVDTSNTSSRCRTPNKITRFDSSVIDRSNVPELMRTHSNKRILNRKPSDLPTNTKKLRMRSLLWVKPQVNVNQLSSSLLAQLIPTLIVNLSALSSGISLGFSAIALPQLKPYMDHYDGDLSDSDLVIQHDPSFYYRPFIVNEEEGSWIASIFGIGAIFGGFAAGILGSHLGRRKALLLMIIPDVFGWLLIIFSQSFTMMLAGRFLCGFAAAGYSPSIQVYVAEISQPHHRGWLSGLTVPLLAVGSLICYTVGAFYSWWLVAVVAAIFPLAMIPGIIFFVADSPYWYLQQGQEKKALRVIEKFRSSDANALAELLAISDSLQDSSGNATEGIGGIRTSADLSLKEALEQMMQRQNRRPFLILNFLFILMTFSGKFAISFYAVEIFYKASSHINEYMSAIVIGLIRLLGSLVFIPAVKRFSRKILLCTSSLAMGVALSILGLAMYSHHNSQEHGHSMQMVASLEWLPLVCVTVFMLADPLGLGSIPFLYTAEFYPSDMRSLLSGVTIGLSNLEMFLLVKTYPNMNSSMGDHGTFWLYAGVCFFTVVYTLLFVPETKGRSLQDIENVFSYKENLHVTPYVTPTGTPTTAKRGIQYPHAGLQFTL